MFSAGVAAIVKTVYLVALSKKADFTWELPTLFCWAAAEIALTIVASSIPTLRPLLKEWGLNSKTESKTYPLRSISNNNNMFYPKSLQAQINTNVSTYSDRTKDESEVYQRESPVPTEQGHKRESRGIRTTTDVTTTYSNSGIDKLA